VTPSGSPAATVVDLAPDQWGPILATLGLMVFFGAAALVSGWRHGRGL
jgi:hypothetical protein